MVDLDFSAITEGCPESGSNDELHTKSESSVCNGKHGNTGKRGSISLENRRRLGLISGYDDITRQIQVKQK